MKLKQIYLIIFGHVYFSVRSGVVMGEILLCGDTKGMFHPHLLPSLLESSFVFRNIKQTLDFHYLRKWKNIMLQRRGVYWPVPMYTEFSWVTFEDRMF
jgi:hypothetical protein